LASTKFPGYVEQIRHRKKVRVVRDYGMFDRR